MKTFLKPAFFSVAIVFFAGAPKGHAQFSLYYEQNSFLGDGRVSDANTLTFDSFGVGADLTAAGIGGLTLNAPGSGPLRVIDASVGIRGPLLPRSANTVLSPGGSNASLENDDLEILFASPVFYFGLDVVFDVPDASFTSVIFYDISGNVLGQNSFIPDPAFARDYQFVGGVSDSANIARVSFDEFDGSAPDDNIAYDNFLGPMVVVPEPGTLALFGIGLAGLLTAARRRNRQAR